MSASSARLPGVANAGMAHLVMGAAFFQGAVVQVPATAQHKEQALLLLPSGSEPILERFPTHPFAP